jgi:hypothetical protein
MAGAQDHAHNPEKPGQRKTPGCYCQGTGRLYGLASRRSFGIVMSKYCIFLRSVYLTANYTHFQCEVRDVELQQQ